MKALFTLAFSFCLFSTSIFAQDLKLQAESESRQMAAEFKLNEGEYLKIKKLNEARLEKIMALSELREQDERYLNLRLDQIEEEYAANMFGTLNKKQFRKFMEYRQEQPYTYAGLTMKYRSVAQSEE